MQTVGRDLTSRTKYLLATVPATALLADRARVDQVQTRGLDELLANVNGNSSVMVLSAYEAS